MSQLRGLKTTAPTDPQAARASLSGLIDVLAAFQESASESAKGSVDSVDSVDFYFSCLFSETLQAPQAAVVKLIVAEQLQEQCSLLLSERLAHEDETGSSLNGTTLGTEESKSANHTQRRRANRKKLLKKRRHEAEERLAQQTLLKAALDELKIVFRQKKEQSRRIVSEVLDGIVHRAAVEAKPKASKHHHAQANHTVVDLLDAASSAISSKKKKKCKKAKKNDSGYAAASKSQAEHSSSTIAKLASSAQTIVDEPMDPEEKKNHLHQLASSMTPEDQPLLSFLDKSYSSPISTMPTFGPEPLYTSSPASPPFFLSLPPPRNLQGTNQRNNSAQSEELVVNEERTSNESAGTSGSGQEKSSESNFEWYLPSLFSSESSNHTNSTTSSLDWDFNNWQLKNDASSSTKNSSGILSSAANRAMLRNRPQPPIPSTSKTYSLESFSNMLTVDSKRPRKPSSPGAAAAAADEGSSAEEDSPGDNGGVAMKSDFLYQQGGFFDRQRALKRRRRPLPFDYEDEECCNSDGEGDNTAWVDYPASHCCGCRCQREEEADKSCDCKLNADESHQCSERKRTKSRKPPSSKVQESPEMLERLTRLETALEEKTKVTGAYPVFSCRVYRGISNSYLH